MTLDLTIVLPSTGQTVSLEVTVYPDEIEILDLETGSEWEPASDEDWKAVQAAVSKDTTNEIEIEPEYDIMGLNEFDRGY